MAIQASYRFMRTTWPSLHRLLCSSRNSRPRPPPTSPHSSLSSSSASDSHLTSFARTSRAWTALEDQSLRRGVSLLHSGEITSWKEIASIVGNERDARGCRHRWNLFRDKRVTGTWSPEELRALSELSREFPGNYAEIAKRLPTVRLPAQVRERLVRGNLRIPKVWRAEEDAKLMESVQKHGRKWIKVAEEVGGERTAPQCLERWTLSLNPTLKKGRFTAEEDEMLQKIVDRFLESGKPFTFGDVSREMGGSRSRKICRQRYALLQQARRREEGAEYFDETS